MLVLKSARHPSDPVSVRMLYDSALTRPKHLGGVAGGKKYLWRGILFKLADGSKGPYGGSDEAAAKAAGHELRGAVPCCAVVGCAVLEYAVVELHRALLYAALCTPMYCITNSTFTAGGRTKQNETRRNEMKRNEFLKLEAIRRGREWDTKYVANRRTMSSTAVTVAVRGVGACCLLHDSSAWYHCIIPL